MTSTPLDDQVRDLLRRATEQAPPTPSFDEALLRAERLGVRSQELYVATTPAPTRRHRRSLRTFLATLVAVAGIGGGSYLAYANLVGPDGYDSPTEASEAFVDALSSGDLLRASRALVPFERDHMDARLRNVLRLFTETDTLASNDLGKARHISLRPEGLRWREQPMADGFVRTEATAGHLWLTFDPDLVGGALDRPDRDQTVDLAEVFRPRLGDTADGSERRGTPGFVTTRVDGEWYVTLTYSVFDTAMASVRDQVDLTAPVTARGAESPERAAGTAFERLYGAGLIMTGREFLDVVDPIAGEAFHRYLPLAGVDDPSLPPTIRASEWRIEGDGQWRTATLRSYEYRNLGEDGEPGAWASIDAADCPAADRDACGLVGAVTVALVERDGRWYVDPIESAGRLLSWTLVGRSGADGPTVIQPVDSALDSLEGTAALPPEASRLADGTWSLDFVGGTPPSPQLIQLLAPCLAQRATHPEPDGGEVPEGAGSEFPPGFWYCVSDLGVGYGFSSTAVAPPTTTGTDS